MSSDPNKAVNSNGWNFLPRKGDTYPFIKPSQHDFSGRNVLITGASKGIGRATAISYAAAGASGIAIAARSDLSSLTKEIIRKAEECDRTTPTVVELNLDVGDRRSVESAAEVVKTQLGHIDIAILNAGVLEKFTPILESDPETWWNTWQTNMFGCYLTMRSFVPLLLSSPNSEKTIISTSSVGAHLLTPGASAYQTSKLALIRLAEFLGVEYGKQGLLTYSIHPGSVGTDLSYEMPAHLHGVLKDTPELPADSIVWLTSERRDWLMGRYVSCTWDMEQLLEKKDEIMKRDLLKVRMAVNI